MLSIAWDRWVTLLAARFHFQPSELNNFTVGDLRSWIERLEWLNKTESRAIKRARKSAQ